MNYEEKYKKALEKAKKLYGKYCINNVLEDLFPELKESGDERIRKGITSILEHYKESGKIVCPYPFVSIDEAITWLEKQGEQKPAWSEEVDLEKHLKENIDDVYYDLDGIAVIGGTHYLTVNDLKDIAKHFFELGRNNAIDKACKWLGENFRVSSFDDTKIVTHFSNMYDLEDDFRKAMKGE